MKKEFLLQIKLAVKEAVAEAIGEAAQKKPKYYTRKDLCDLLRVTLRSVDNYVDRGIIKPKKVQGRILFSAEEIDDAIQGGKLTKYSHTK
ncbi:MAG: helix-turn-helix domain-containing protein [Muribaculaceae bacterium]|jgi:hypothetical protein|nr:helix-turn-helix domain-containing protein [Muribaculaceae bacterium]